jgi:hypothetical protein
MPYDWNNQDEFGARMKPGIKHAISLTRVVREKKDGTRYQDDDGNPRLGVAFANGAGEEGIEFFSLTGRFEARFRKFIQAALTPGELDDMIKSGVEPLDFLKQDVSDPLLLGRQLYATGTQKGEYVNWKYERNADGAPAPAASADKPKF